MRVEERVSSDHVRSEGARTRASSTATPDSGSRRGTVLVVDDEEGVRASVRAILEETCEVREAEDGAGAMEILRTSDVDLVMLDQRMPGDPGIDVLAQIKAFDPTILVVLATAVRDVRTAVEALKRGAWDYLTKPFDVDDVLMLAQRALEKRTLEREVLCLRSTLAAEQTPAHGFEGLVGRHSEMVKIFQLVMRIASVHTTVLITGESGTGKELIARAIHRQSPRRSQPFVAINVAALADTLLESELFGHEKGSFTGAHAKKLGKFELAQGGTVFLDEIGSLRLDLQTKLLRALQEREIERVGGVRPIAVDVRVLAATNVNLARAVREGAFRADLFYRLNVVPIHVPPLRERRDDIRWLVEHFVRRIARESGRDVRAVSAGALDALCKYDWPGNVRELENVIHRAVVLARTPVLQLQDVPLDVAIPETGAGLTEESSLPLREACDKFERQYVLRVLESVGWNVSRAARHLGVHRNTVLAKLAVWKVHRPVAGGDARSLSL
jgi:DNA-binding NtrC family response regulator